MPQQNPNDGPAAWAKAYGDVQGLYVSFVNQLKELLSNLLSQESVKDALIDGRAKTIASFAEKIRRPGKAYQDPLNEISDLAGIRVIVSNLGLVKRVCEVVDTAFEIDARSVNKLDELGVDRFGYLSIHKVVRLREDRCKMPEWKRYSGLVAEIQVRTILQHAWAGISHSLQYKQEQDIPTQFRRRLVRVASLLELADDEFLSVLSQQREYAKVVSASLNRQELEIRLSADSVTPYVTDSTTAFTIERFGRDAKFKIQTSESRELGDLLEVCRIIGIGTIADLEAKLQQAMPKAADYLERLWRNSNTEWLVNRAFLLTLVLIALDVERFTPEWFKELGWDKGICDLVTRTAAEVYGNE